MVACVLTGMVQGVEGILVRVEADISPGLPMMNLFGSLSAEAREGKDRVRTALRNIGIHLPPNRITINLAPGDVRKSGTSYDLGIGVALFIALGLVPAEAAEDILFLGELSLDGGLLPVHGVLPILKSARDQGYSRCIVPTDNLEEASLLEGMEADGLDCLQEVFNFLVGKNQEYDDVEEMIEDTGIGGNEDIAADGDGVRTEGGDDDTAKGGDEDRAEDSDKDRADGGDEDRADDSDEDRADGGDEDRADDSDEDRADDSDEDRAKEKDKDIARIIVQDFDSDMDKEDLGDNEKDSSDSKKPSGADFSEVRGQHLAKRALEIAVAGFHNVLLDGPPGVGKSMVASCVPGIMPEMTMEEKIEATMIYSVKGLLGNNFFLVEDIPFRAPSHNITMMGMFGGGSDPVPGEISLAHHGVLFLDEIPEYGRDMLELLRVPLENHRIVLVRNNRSIEFPADFILIGASNPCPCGYYPDRSRCRCSNREIRRYQNRISGPMRDRIDLFVRCEEVGYETLTSSRKEESSATVRHRVTKAWDIQRSRSIQRSQSEKKGSQDYHFNGRMSSGEVGKYCDLTAEGNRMMSASFRSLGLSGRSYYRVLKVARTIADLAGEESINTVHLEEALLFRNALTQ